MAAQDRLQGETVSKWWSNKNKDSKPRDLIYRLKAGDGGVVAIRSEQMAELARAYHNDLLTSGIHPNKDEREEAIKSSLGSYQTLSNSQRNLQNLLPRT